MKTFKYEEVHMQEYTDYDDAYQNIQVFIEEVYDKKRIHSKIGYLPPNEYEKRANLSAKVA
jgi:transposase InsO family protein